MTSGLVDDESVPGAGIDHSPRGWHRIADPDRPARTPRKTLALPIRYSRASELAARSRRGSPPVAQEDGETMRIPQALWSERPRRPADTGACAVHVMQIAAPALLLIVGCAARSSEPPERRVEADPRAHPPVERFLDCLSMWRAGWVEGVTLWGSGETYPSRWAEAQKQTYRLNRHLAGNILGEACHHPETYQHIDGRARVKGWIRADKIENDP